MTILYYYIYISTGTTNFECTSDCKEMIGSTLPLNLLNFNQSSHLIPFHYIREFAVVR